jgi:hypothetical protein
MRIVPEEQRRRTWVSANLMKVSCYGVLKLFNPRIAILGVSSPDNIFGTNSKKYY